jgi:hypothetical protein
MDYRVALGKLFTAEEVQQARLTSPSFEREFNLSFQGHVGNVFSPEVIDRAIALSESVNSQLISNPQARKCLGIDVGWGSSAMAFCLTQSEWVDGTNNISVLFAEQYTRPDYDQMLSLTLDLLHRYHKVTQVMIDSSAPEFISGLKRALGERSDYLEHIADIRKRYPTNPKMQYKLMRVHPISFSTEHKRMLSNAKQWMDSERVAIHPKFDKLITSLRTCQAVDNAIDKQTTIYDDTFDSFRLSMNYWIYTPPAATVPPHYQQRSDY